MSRFAQRLYFRVGRGVMINHGAVAASSHDLAIAHDHGANRDLAERQRPQRFAQRFLHEQFVRVGHKEAITN